LLKNMYGLQQSIKSVKGVGPATTKALTNYGLETILDLLLHIPLRYEDRSHHTQIAALQVGQVVTLTGTIINPRNFYKGRRSIQSATLQDATGKVKLMWFNNPHVIDRFRLGAQFLVSGTLNDRGTITQPTVEAFKSDTIHTGRLVPIYPNIPQVPPGTLRRILKEVTDYLDTSTAKLDNLMPPSSTLPPLVESLCQIHFPDDEIHITFARERLAIEELVQLIMRSHALKDRWRQLNKAPVFPLPVEELGKSLPFELTTGQKRSLSEILADLNSAAPMNRLLLGDVGSGKTAVAGLASQHVMRFGAHACLITPTQILAEQHAQTIARLFPELPLQILTAQTKKKEKEIAVAADKPTLFVGTHAILSQLEKLQPGLIVYDEQHRFGVKQRSVAQHLDRHPHVLTLTATPIPRTLLLTIFSHLSLSVIDELPPGRKPIKSWLVPQSKKDDAYRWIGQQLTESQAANQALIVCPFIDPSHLQAFENVTAASQLHQQLTETFAEMAPQLPRPIRVGLLHGRMTKREQQEVSGRLFAQEIDVLVTTPIVEVGLDLPAASIIVIEAAERFGMASLHQLRGRVGRAGQQGYCLLFTHSEAKEVKERLTKFSQTTNGLELAEQDLQRRGAGDIFGTQQHGLDQLQFANWTNLQLVTQAKQLAEHIEQMDPEWRSPLHDYFAQHDESAIPLAN
jgi:ATP-dependent DNA helicase RecG